jgi:transposase
MHGILGIDVAKDKVDVCLVVEGKAPQSGVFENTLTGHTKLRKWLGKAKLTCLDACMEATGRYSDDLAEFLHAAGYTVSVVNPARIKGYAHSQLRRNKTDKLDAALIADFCRTQQPLAWTPPAPEWKELQALVRHLDDLQQMLTQERNRLHATPPSARVRADLTAHIAFLEQQIKQVKRQMQAHLNQHPDLKQQRDLLVSIPGIADLTAAKLLAEIPDIRRFETANQLVAYAGLNPTQRQSGKSASTHTPFSKIGSAPLRTAIYMPSCVARRHNPHFSALADRLIAKGKPKMVAFGAIMRRMLVLAFAVLKSGKPYDPNFHPQKA